MDWVPFHLILDMKTQDVFLKWEIWIQSLKILRGHVKKECCYIEA